MDDTLVSRNKSRARMQQVSSHGKKPSRKTPRRPVTPGKSKKTGHEQWMTALKKRQALTLANTYRAASPRRKTPTEFFVDTLRKTGVGLSSETNKSQSMTGLKGPNDRQYPYMSTPHYLRQVMGAERVPRSDDPAARPSAGTPNYKSPEEYYDEILGLRKQIAALNHDSATSKTKIRRLEEDNTKKEKEIEGLLNPGKNGELRRTLGDRQADSSAVVHSLKQKILKLEQQLRDKEGAYNKLQADLKTTKLDEMRVQMEAMYAEVLRLQMSRDTGVEKSRGGDTTAKVKALNETVIRLSKTNEQLQVENKALKDDLHRALEDSEAKLDVKRDYADMNRKELLLTLTKFEKRLDRAESRMDGDTMSLLSQESSRKPQGKVDLQGSVEDRLQQLDQRETELLDEVDRLKSSLRRHRDDKKRTDDGSSLPPTPRRRQSKAYEDGTGSRPQSGRKSSRVEAGSRPTSSRSRDGRVENFTQKHAATSIQRQWRNRQQRKQEEEQRQVAARKIQSVWKDRKNKQNVQAFRENRAAKKIQHEWLDYKHRRYDDEVDQAAYTIQSALKGHRARRQRMKDWDPEDYESSETDDGVFLIQSSLRGHHTRTHQLRNWRNQYSDDDADSVLSGSYGRRLSRPSSAQRPSSSGRPMSAGRASIGSRPGTGQRPGSAQRPLSGSKRGSVSHTFKARYDVPSPSHLDDDDDDDIMM
ncbi:IQ domain-containing protein E [Aplysia californica]|uniref:IQ domain-containing protein E n=1 Tax=Aplysia californica TaxID=6500 RepID=A0ABM1A2Q6_APLCA|nr:IQ domain-containing protein E [Aplysia californica]XP_012939652.1 IQ domain-containing protein E [Aplysia californica]